MSTLHTVNAAVVVDDDYDDTKEMRKKNENETDIYLI